VNRIRLVRPIGTTMLLAVALNARPAAGQIPDSFTNLQVLPPSIGRDSLVSIMRSFSLALGVRCQ
jgi:hypothetical protein